MLQDWSLPERALVIELAVGIARRLSIVLAGSEADRPEPEYFHHYYTTDFENGCDVLWRLGVAVAAYGPEQGRNDLAYGTVVEEKVWPPYFKFYTSADLRAALADGFPESAPALDEILSAYVGVACNYGPTDSALSNERGSFLPQQVYRRELEALERLGYVKTCGSGMVWTDKIAPAMKAAYLWQDDGRSRQTVEEDALAEECGAALAATPDFTRWRLRRAARRHSELDFVLILRDQYDGLYLKKNPDGSPREMSIPLVKAIYNALKRRP